MKSYKGKNVFITGGSEGIGRAVASLLSQRGANVFIFSRSKEKLKTAAAACGCTAVQLDVTDFEKTKRQYKSLAAKHGGIDILINAAGFSHPDHFEKIPMEKFRAMMEVNYFGVVNSVMAALPFMKEKGGQIVNVSSMSGFLPVFGYSGYTGSKFAVLGFSEVLRSELKQYNIGVSVLCPPDTDTPGFEKENATKPADTVEISKGAKLLTPEQVAAALEKEMRKNRTIIIPGFEGKLAYRVRRLFPGLLAGMFDSAVRKVRKRQQQGS